MDYLEQLNQAQREAVVNTEGPCMVIAGAGSGKTRVLTYRIAHLIKANNVDSFRIMALTFTNKASAEMRQRIEKVVGSEAKNLWMGTFHSVFARILRADGSKLGYPSNFSIYDTDDSKSLIRSIVKELGLDDKLYRANTVHNRISGAKNRLISWQEYNENPIFQEEDSGHQRPELGRIYKMYQNRCFKAAAMDFDDLLFNTNVLFRDHIDVLNKYQQRFHYLLVDEFQDTNVSQYVITKRLSAVRENICVVGDDAQSIYAFRGANIENILNFEKDFPDLKIFRMEQNYRSTQNIVNAANSVIQRNQAQIRKEVWTQNESGELIQLIKATSDNEEGKLVAASIFQEKANFQVANKDFAILYRTNSQSRSIEEALRRINIRYKVVGGLSFYQRKEIKDLMGYFRFATNENDEQALRRIINTPKRGIGSSSIDKIVIAAFDHDIGVWEVIQNIEQFLGSRASRAIRSFADMITSFRIHLQKLDAFEAATYIAKHSGLLKELYEDKTIEGLSRYENVQELLNAIKEFVDNSENEDKSLSSFLQEIALITDQDDNRTGRERINPEDDDRVTLMTIHSAKGLEFRNLYVVGMEEDLFPSQMMLSSRADLEEERRLFYVAITRSKQKLTLSYALSRYRFGRLKNCEPSRFIEEVEPRYIQIANRPSSIRTTNFQPKPIRNNLQHLKKPSGPSPNQIKYHNPSPDFKPSDTSGLIEGMKVEHPKFGYGTVTNMDIQGANRKAKVKFDNFGEKTLLLSFAKLKILDS